MVGPRWTKDMKIWTRSNQTWQSKDDIESWGNKEQETCNCLRISGLGSICLAVSTPARILNLGSSSQADILIRCWISPEYLVAKTRGSCRVSPKSARLVFVAVPTAGSILVPGDRWPVAAWNSQHFISPQSKAMRCYEKGILLVEKTTNSILAHSLPATKRGIHIHKSWSNFLMILKDSFLYSTNSSMVPRLTPHFHINASTIILWMVTNWKPQLVCVLWHGMAVVSCCPRLPGMARTLFRCLVQIPGLARFLVYLHHFGAGIFRFACYWQHLRHLENRPFQVAWSADNSFSRFELQPCTSHDELTTLHFG